jgi:L-malate glycosyltransferase
MRVTLAGPIDTGILRELTGLSLDGAPPGQGSSPVPDLAAGLMRAGLEVNVVTEDASVKRVETFEGTGLTVHYVPLRAPPAFKTRWRMLDLFEVEVRHLERAISSTAPDIVHAHWTYEYAEAAVRTRLPHLVTMHDLGWDYFWIMRDTYRFVRLIMKYRTMVRVRNLTVVAPFMLPKLGWYGFTGSSRCIPNGIIVPSEYTQKHLSDTSLTFVTIGNTGNIKNVSASVAAFERIRESHPTAQLHLFGPGLDETFGARHSHVHCHGNVDHATLMSFLLKHATVLIHPSRMEACPVIIAEAKATGTPIVGGARSGGVPFVCGVEGGSLLVDIDDPKAIAEAALSIVASDDVYTSMSRQALDDVRTRFDSDLVTQQYLAAYHSVLGASSR